MKLMILLIKFKLFISKRFNKISFLFNDDIENNISLIRFPINLLKAMNFDEKVLACAIDNKIFF